MNTFTFVVAVLLWLTVAWRAVKVWRRGQDRSLWWAFFGLAVMMTLRMPPGRALDQWTGVTDLSYLLKHLIGGVLASAALLAFLRKVSGASDGPRTKRRRIMVACATALAMAVLFFAKLQPYETPSIFADPVARYVFLAYTLLFLGYLTASLLGGVRLCWRWGRNASGPALSWGLRTIGVGLAAGVGYAVVRAATITTRMHGDGLFPGAVDDYISTALLMAALVLIVAGSSLPMLSLLHSWRIKRHALLRLRPLWRDLTQVTPSVRLHAPRSAVTERLNPLNVHDRLYRRGVEIRDAALALNNYASPALRKRAQQHAEARGLFGTQAAIAAEACWLATARRAKFRGAAPGSSVEHRPAGGGRDLNSEISALTQLSDAYHSDLVRDFTDSEDRLMEPLA
ncbi:MAB_1171c family putative transporter [Streptomyces sp. GD-15H]|uniref:MAB_1171c family putative transporter n=1 Tax=Streptomyces sp. GD-15H TaxID=3129112 RepID=UPI00324A399A